MQISPLGAASPLVPVWVQSSLRRGPRAKVRDKHPGSGPGGQRDAAHKGRGLGGEARMACLLPEGTAVGG